MVTYRIATIPGDGIGPEVMSATTDALKALTKKVDGINFDFTEYLAGDECKKRFSEALPAETVEGAKDSDACLFAAVGNTAKEVIIPLRQKLDLYVNLRPAKVFPGVPAVKENVDIVVVRENSEGIYKMVGHRSKGFGVNLRIITREASERIAKYAFEYAINNDRRKVTSVHKVNVIDYSDEVFLEATRKISKEYTDIDYEELIVDACAMKLILAPQNFDVIVTTNMFGDILSDEIAGLVGGLGMAPSANIGDDKAIFEPVHGSAPDIAGKQIANPVATMLSASMMLKWLNQNEASIKLEKAIIEVLKKGRNLTPDLGGTATTGQMTASIIKEL